MGCASRWAECLPLQVEVGHDGVGHHAAWHLAWVRVTNLDTGETATFECNRSSPQL